MITANLSSALISEAQFTQVYWRMGILFAFVVFLFAAALMITKIVTAKNSRNAKRAPDAGGDHTLSTSWLTNMKTQAGASDENVGPEIETISIHRAQDNTPGVSRPTTQEALRNITPQLAQPSPDPNRIIRPDTPPQSVVTKSREFSPAPAAEMAPPQRVNRLEPSITKDEPSSPFGQVNDLDDIASTSGTD